MMDRRKFLGAGAAALGLVASRRGWAEESPGSFDFIFFTDTHIQPELAAADGCQMCFRKIRSIPADFAIQGGDHVFDALAVGRARADKLFELYKQTEHALEIPIYHTIGNHDAFGVSAASGIRVNDPAYGKKLFEDRIGRRTYQSLAHKGYRFIVLDSIQPTPDRQWEARIDEEQLEWLKSELAKSGAHMPTVVIVHVPLVTASSSYAPAQRPGEYQTSSVANAYQVLPLFTGRNVLGVLQGHTHINEVVEWKGIPYITRGAVCGNWWHGTRWGTPEGFTVVRLRNGKMSWSYETYGFKSVDPKNT
ncbi:MAG TPA: metallophosphoesterase [Bryobacteraceae bacterium]|nr:metallophosphoesterase [Bryobacteraceae bacterium]